MIAAERPQIRIRPASGWTSLRLGELWEYRDVLLMLALRDIKLRYKQTALGVLWVILQPLLSGLIFATVFGRFAHLPSGGQPYLLFVFAGLLGWNLFAGILQRAGNSLVAESRLITKVYFPRLLLPCASAAAALVDFCISLMVMVAMLLWYGVWPGSSLLLLPVVVTITVTTALGISLWVSALNVRYRDFTYALPFLVQVLMYASPVVYGAELIPLEWRAIYGLNPLVATVEGFRQAFLGHGAVSPQQLSYAGLIAVVIITSGAFFFRRIERSFAESL